MREGMGDAARSEDSPANRAVIRLPHPITPKAANLAAQPPARQSTVAGVPVTMGKTRELIRPRGADPTTLTTAADSSKRIRLPIQALR
jgi:hypothetical protein